MKRKIQNLGLALVCLLVIFPYGNNCFAQRKMERLDRGLVAVKVTNGVFLSWRVFGNEPQNVSFNIYRGTTRVNSSPITGATNLIDAAGTTTSTYTVRPVINGVEQTVGGTASVWASQVLTVNLQRPAGGSNPSGSYTYSPNDISVGDVDGDGEYELILKWNPSDAKDNSQSGYTGNVFIDCYKLNGTRLWRIDLGINIRAGAHYTQFLVGDYDGDGFAEVAMKTAPGTRDGSGAFISKGAAASADHSADYRNSSGYILSGPEYLTIFNGRTGRELATVNYNPGRGTVSSWGDSYGNRVDRFNATNAYLDGKKPSMVFQRGYYTRMTVAAWDWDGTTLRQRWFFDSNATGNGAMAGNGNHSIMAADGDGDGFDEIYTGSGAIDHDGKLMWCTRMGHGDANHIGDFDISNPGLEVWQVTESSSAQYDHLMIDARTGRILWGAGGGNDNGRGMAGDLLSSSPGQEVWSNAVGGLHSATGTQVSSTKPSSCNFRVYWDGDLQDELLDANRIDKYTGSGSTRVLTLTGNSCNGTKSTPNLSADILGDWREEVILHDGASRLYIHTTTTPTTHKLYTLMHDPVYRNAISWQQSSYNQPPHLGFFLGNGTDKAPIPNITTGEVSCIPTPTTPFYKINNGNWIEGANVTALESDVIVLGPHPLQEGTWSWTGAGTSGSLREQTLVFTTKGTYQIVATFTNICGAKTSQTFTIQINEPVKDCAGVVNGTAYTDYCGNCVGGTTQKLPCTFLEAENACEYNGVIEATNTGFNGLGYVNPDNQIGASIKIGINSTISQSTELYIRYANGVTDDRAGTLLVNNSNMQNVSFPTTGTWTAWTIKPVTVQLKAGDNNIIFSATTAGGLPNIDLFAINSSNIKFTDCKESKTNKISLKAGWNIIGCPIEGSTDLNVALHSIMNYVISVKDFDSFYHKDNPAFLNTLQKLEWARGYLINVSQACDLIWDIK
ncbi:MAG: hypothetical protein SNJ71_02525 [Bacteroidales bacterium]